jgi:hypothetical protein
VFSDPTVFVIGAGASAEYSIAVGDQLKTKIADLLNFYYDHGQLPRGDDQIGEYLRRYNQALTGQYGIRQEHLGSARLISDAMPHALSIDNFIDAHRGNQDIALCAKLGIVKAILVEESKSNLAGLKDAYRGFDFRSVPPSWIARLFQMITENVSTSEINSVFDNVALIVFNYDRCVEAYFPPALQQYYGLTQAQAEQLLTKLTIIHPYGVAGGLDASGRLTVPFGSTDVNLLEAAQNIRTFSEGIADPRLGAAIKAALTHAHTLVFLGFSFHPLNMELLEAEAPYLKRIFGTTFGLSKSAVTTVERQLLLMYDKLDPKVTPLDYDERHLDELELEPLSAYDFCTQYFRSLSSTRLLGESV